METKNNCLLDKVAFITGAGSGIGQALAVGFAKYGADIVIADINEENMKRTQEMISEVGRKSICVSVNVQQHQDFERAFSQVMQEMGKLDILVNNAGYSRLYPLTHPKCSVEVLDNILKTNTLGPLYGTHAILPFMTQNKGGTILTTGSTIVDQPAPGWTAYSMSKSSLIGFTECLALELKQNKINVNLIMPRMVRTPLLHGMKEEQINSMNPMQPEELIDYFAFFATDEGAKLTGQLVNVDLIENLVTKAKEMPHDQQNWNGIKEMAENTLKKEEFKKIKKLRKLIDFLLAN